MRNNLLSTLLFCSLSFWAQNKNSDFKQIQQAEMKSASAKMNFVSNPNTSNYDITYHKLEFQVDPAVYNISGKVTTNFTALSNMNSVIFDLTNQLVVNNVTQNGNSLNFTQNSNNELVITLPNTLIAGNSTSVEITYSGAPSNSNFGSFVKSTHNGSPIIWTLSEPFGARDWWPCKQDLNDKADKIDVYITAPDQYTSVSNGKPIGIISNLNNTKTTHFQHNYPIPAYLIAIAVTNYATYKQTGGTAPNSFPIINYLYPENLSDNISNLDKTLSIMNLYENLFETYPFADEKYGHAQFGWNGGMEHTTVSFMGSFGRQLIAHELGHQWFGDKITCGSWQDIWLNEGFATYLATLVIENLDGQSAFVNEKNNMISNITSQPGGAVYLTETEATSVGRIFDQRLTYNKGAMVLNMLRFKLGDAIFFQAIKNYLADSNLAYKYAFTPQLKTHFENASGKDLTEFFNDWIYGQGYPIYNIQYQNIGNNQVNFTINQTTSHSSVSFFEMPVPIRVLGTKGEILDLILENTFKGQTFTKNVPFEISSVEFDPDKNIISKNNSITLGFNELNTECFKIYPNPTKDKLFLQLPNNVLLKKSIIYDIKGLKISETNSTTIPTSDLSTGTYLIKIITSEGEHQEKFIKN